MVDHYCARIDPTHTIGATKVEAVHHSVQQNKRKKLRLAGWFSAEHWSGVGRRGHGMKCEDVQLSVASRWLSSPPICVWIPRRPHSAPPRHPTELPGSRPLFNHKVVRVVGGTVESCEQRAPSKGAVHGGGVLPHPPRPCPPLSASACPCPPQPAPARPCPPPTVGTAAHNFGRPSPALANRSKSHILRLLSKNLAPAVCTLKPREWRVDLLAPSTRVRLLGGTF